MIEVRITAADTSHVFNDYRCWTLFVANKLRENGIPVIGNDNIYSVKSGLLKRFDDINDFGACTYVWYEETKKPPEGG